VAWANHDGNTVFQTQDANGPIRHGTFEVSCSTLSALDLVTASNPELGTLAQLLNHPADSACPTSSQAPGSGGG